MKFFAGSSNKPLALKVAQKLGVSIASSELVRFDDGELKPVIKTKVRDETCVILQSTTQNPNDYWMELFFMADALKREAAKKVIAVIPSFGYARQNQQHQKGEPVSAHVLVHFLEEIGISEVITVDLHDETMTGMFDIPITNISALGVLAKAVVPYLSNNYAVVSPDQGGIERARFFAESLKNKKPLVTVEKKRELQKAHQSQAMQVLGNVSGINLVIQDDVMTSGRTILHAMDALTSQGAKDIYVCVVHQDFSKDTPQKLSQSSLKKMFITNSVVTADSQTFPKLQIVDISELLAAQIQKVI